MTKFFADRRVHLVLVTLGFALLAVADVGLSAVKDGTLALPASLGPVLAPYIPIVSYMIASWRRELGTASTVQQQIADAAAKSAQARISVTTTGTTGPLQPPTDPPTATSGTVTGPVTPPTIGSTSA